MVGRRLWQSHPLRYAGLIPLVFVCAACHNDHGPTAPASEPAEPVTVAPAPQPAPVPSSPREPVAFQLTGLVSDDSGAPISGARIMINFLASDAPGTHYSQTPVVTDGRGMYSINFSALHGAMKGPAGTEEAVAFGYVTTPDCLRPPSGCAHESDSRYIISRTEQAVHNFKVHRLMRVSAGESVVVTVMPGDSICSNNFQDMHPWPTEFVCRSVRIVAPLAGLMEVQAIPAEGGAAEHNLEIEAGLYQYFANPASFPVAAGDEITASVEIPWGSLAPRSFVVKTALHSGDPHAHVKGPLRVTASAPSR